MFHFVYGAPGAPLEWGSAWQRRVELLFRPFRVQPPLEGRSAFRTLDTALRAEL